MFKNYLANTVLFAFSILTLIDNHQSLPLIFILIIAILLLIILTVI